MPCCHYADVAASYADMLHYDAAAFRDTMSRLPAPLRYDCFVDDIQFISAICYCCQRWWGKGADFFAIINIRCAFG